MREQADLKGIIRGDPVGTARRVRRSRIMGLCVIGWTVFVGLALWGLQRGNAGPTVWIVREANSSQNGMAEKPESFFRSEIGLQRGYPWILLGPYVALAVLFFPLERGRLRLSLPMNLAACVAFVAASHAINARTRAIFTGFTIIKSEPGQDARETNRIHVRISNAEAGKLRLEQLLKIQDGSEASLTNLPVQLRQGFKLPPLPPGAPKLSLWSTLVDLLAYGAVCGLSHSVHFYRRFRERERRALFLESNLAHARLNALRAQLHPHFLFNSLNAIAALLRRDPRLAEATLMSLSELLRLALSHSERQEIALREEMQFVHRYLEIQQTRFGDKLHVEQNIHPAALDCLVPALVLQPLIENAIRHGIEPAETAGLVRLTAQRKDGNLLLMVEDDGVGLPTSAIGAHESKATAKRAHTNRPTVAANSSASAASGGTGIGLTNLRARLETLYGARQKLELAPRPEGGVPVCLEIPYHPVIGVRNPADCNAE